MADLNLDHLNQWLGKEQTAVSSLSPETANLMQATLNRPPTFKAGDVLPPAWHWLYFHEPVSGTNLGVEGHAKLGGFMPPVSYGGDAPPRRMWAGGTFEFIRPLHLGDEVKKVSRIKEILPKNGRSGRLCFVIVEHDLYSDGTHCLHEEQTIVYREPTTGKPKPIQAKPAPIDADFSTTVTPDPIMLFRYSALTFNGHRIHYDVDFCREHEGYPNLVVHGPLIATLLLDQFVHKIPEKTLTRVEYRAQSPLFIPNPFTVNIKQDGEAWASNHEGGKAMHMQVFLK